MLVTGTKWTADIPHEKGQTMTFRRLSWREWEHAAEVKRDEALDMFKGMPAELLDAMKNREAASAEKAEDAEQFDTFALLRAGIVAWSYGGEVSAQNINLLDPQTAEWAVAQIMATRETDRKNSSSASTAA